MKAKPVGRTTQCWVGPLAIIACLTLGSTTSEGGAQVVEQDDFSLELGLRIQPRLELEPVGGDQWNRDFVVRRTRVKASGKMLEGEYKFEWKIDGTDQIGASPAATVENAYIQWPLGPGVKVRAGLYDQPFSRDRLTSDSRQLAVDRGEVSNVLDALGLVDNAVGFHFLGKIGGRAEYGVGLFDNRKIPGGFQDFPMVVGRLDLNFGSTEKIFEDAHFGHGTWYSVGMNGSYQGGIENVGGDDDGTNQALGADGMMDIPAGPGRLFAKAEVNAVRTEAPGANNAIDTTVWMAGLGFLVLERLQPIVRFDQVRLDDVVGGGTRNVTHVGANFYQKGHSLKIQADVRLESGTGQSVDGGRLQAQLDF